MPRPDPAASQPTQVPDANPLAGSSTSELLRLYGSILTALRTRGIDRSENSPVGDYAEHLASRAFDLTLTTNSAIGYDGVDAAGVRYQVKGRRITPWNRSRQLGAIRGLGPTSSDPFDVLVGVLFNGDFTVLRAALIPVSVVRTNAKAQPHVNGWRLMLTDGVWLLPDVVDATEQVRAAAAQDDADE